MISRVILSIIRYNLYHIYLYDITISYMSIKGPKTYKHSVKGSESLGWHVTKVSMGIKSENLMFFKAFKLRATLYGSHI